MYWGKYLEQRVYNDNVLKESVWQPSPDEDIVSEHYLTLVYQEHIRSTVWEQPSEEDMWTEEKLRNKWLETFQY